METLRIETFEARYHLPPSATGEREQLDRLLPAAVGEALEHALERQGIRPEEEVCLREVRVPVRLPPRAGDGSVVLAWSQALAEAIGEALRAGGPGIVRYASRRQALVDFATGTARGDRGRGWAWRQLGFGGTAAATAGEAARALGRALAAEDGGTGVVPVLAALAASGDLSALARRLDSSWWRELAAVAVRAAAWPAEILERPEARGPVAMAPGTPAAAPAGAELVRRLDAAFRGSHLARALAELPATLRSDAEAGRALATLALLDADPAPARSATELERRIGAAARLLSGAGRTGRREEREEARPTGGAQRRAAGSAAAAPPASEAPPGPPVATATDEPSGEAPEEEPEARVAARRRTGPTAWGGLPFLVALLDEMGVPDELASAPGLAGRPFRWPLHRLALELVPIEPDDPTALAFAGLPPGSEPPSAGEAPPEEEERAAVRALAGRVAAALAERLGREDEATPALVERVCRRRARVVADPGWIEIRLSLDDVSTELRRARLDLDPGWVPWLGVVLRFFYE